MKKYILILLTVLFGQIAFAQPVRVAPKEFAGRENNNPLFEAASTNSHRLEATGPQIPLFENFNYKTPSEFSNLWDSSGVAIVRLIDGPGAFGVKFNGIRNNKSKYNSTDTNAIVKTDTLTSKPFNSASLNFASQSASINFIWQGGGLGSNQPDSAKGELLKFYAKGSDGVWIILWTSPSLKNYSKNSYYKVSLPDRKSVV